MIRICTFYHYAKARERDAMMRVHNALQKPLDSDADFEDELFHQLEVVGFGEARPRREKRTIEVWFEGRPMLSWSKQEGLDQPERTSIAGITGKEMKELLDNWLPAQCTQKVSALVPDFSTSQVKRTRAMVRKGQKPIHAPALRAMVQLARENRARHGAEKVKDLMTLAEACRCYLNRNGRPWNLTTLRVYAEKGLLATTIEDGQRMVTRRAMEALHASTKGRAVLLRTLTRSRDEHRARTVPAKPARPRRSFIARQLRPIRPHPVLHVRFPSERKARPVATSIGVLLDPYRPRAIHAIGRPRGPTASADRAPPPAPT